MILSFKKLDATAITPSRGSEYAAGLDLHAHLANGKTTILPGETKKIGTGICVEIPTGYFGAIFARSGLATKHGLRPANCVGVIDSDYRGELIVAIHNDSDRAELITYGDRIAQLVIIPYLPVELYETTTLTDTARGTGGFGSTGVSQLEPEQLSLAI